MWFRAWPASPTTKEIKWPYSVMLSVVSKALCLSLFSCRWFSHFFLSFSALSQLSFWKQRPTRHTHRHTLHLLIVFLFWHCSLLIVTNWLCNLDNWPPRPCFFSLIYTKICHNSICKVQHKFWFAQFSQQEKKAFEFSKKKKFE